MSRARFLVLFIAAVVVFAAAFYIDRDRGPKHDRIGAALLPDLAGQLTQITAVTIRHGAETPIVSLRRADPAVGTGSAPEWTVVERAGYAANVTNLRKLLLSIADAKIVEQKTSNPASYAIVGVDDPSAPDAVGTAVDITAPNWTRRLIVGKPQGNGTVVRLAAEAASYLVEPAIVVNPDVRSWIDATLIDIPVAAIASLTIRPATGPAYGLHRQSPGNDEFSLDAVPAGRAPLDAKALAPSPLGFGALTADDVVPAETIDFSTAAVAVVTRTDGEVITATGAATGDQRWLRLSAARDAAFNAKTQGRAYAVPRYRYDAIFRPLEQLLQPKPAVPSKAHP
jgi:hypothetical protein